MTPEKPQPGRRHRRHSQPSLLTVQQSLQDRLVSRGGRPSDPAPTIRRLLPIKKEVWKLLQRRALMLSRLGKRVSPGQLAALLLERTVSDLEAR
jgi:hypothetical protein